MLNVVKLLDEIERFYQDFVKDIIEGGILYAVAGFVYALLDREITYGKVELEEIDRKNNKIVFAIRFVRDGKERTLKLEIYAKVPPKITVYYD